jgi:hypothetical protein
MMMSICERSPPAAADERVNRQKPIHGLTRENARVFGAG